LLLKWKARESKKSELGRAEMVKGELPGRRAVFRRNAKIFFVVFGTVSVLGAACRDGKTHRKVASAGARENTVHEAPFPIVATDSGFLAATAVAAGIRHITFENRGTQIHEAMIVKLPAGMTANSYVQAFNAGIDFPKGALDYSGPGLTSPGESTELWLQLDPGRYMLMCFNTGHPRAEQVHEFGVQPPAVNDPVPTEDVVLRLKDYRFQLTGKLRSGLRVIRIETPGPAMHEADLFRLPEGATVADLNRWYREGSGGAPARALGGALDHHDIRRIVWVRRRFSPGRYALHCAMPANVGATGKGSNLTHADLGMVSIIDISE
jgi:hypothetical protein